MQQVDHTATDAMIHTATDAQLVEAATTLGYPAHVVKNADRITAKLLQEHPDDVRRALPAMTAKKVPLAYLQHGAGTKGPFRTEAVAVKENPMGHHTLGLSFTATGYGSKIPTRYMVQVDGRWYRVYSQCYSNVSSEYITLRGERIAVTLGA